MSSAAIRISVSGLPGTGKSTLAVALGEHFGVPVMPENLLAVANADRDYSRAIEARDTVNLQRLGKAMAESFLEWQSQRAEAYQASESFIADRWDADLLDWWLVSFGLGASQVDSYTSTLIEGLVSAAKRIDLAVVTPIMPPFAAGLNEEGNGRLTTMTKHVLTNTVITGVIRRYTTTPVLELPARPMTVGQRVDAVVAALGSGR